MDEKRLQSAAMMRWFTLLGSLRVTLAGFVFLGIGILIAYFNESHTTPWLTAALLLMAGNLLAAIVTRPYFRRQRPLLLFHLALLVLIVLIAFGRLSYFSGQAELLSGTEFDGQLRIVEEGPWHIRAYDKLRFTSEDFTIMYGEGLYRLPTRNPVSWMDDDGQRQRKVIGDDVPLVLDGYRFYTTPNKGFAMVFDWLQSGQPPVRGAVMLPSYPARALEQANEWHLPGKREPVWTMLQLDEEVLKFDQPGEFVLPKDYRVVVRFGEQRLELPPVKGGQTTDLPRFVDFPEGRLVYVGMRSWMGYKVTRDPTLPWLLAVASLAVLAMAWHFWRKFAATSWDA